MNPSHVLAANDNKSINKCGFSYLNDSYSSLDFHGTVCTSFLLMITCAIAASDSFLWEREQIKRNRKSSEYGEAAEVRVKHDMNFPMLGKKQVYRKWSSANSLTSTAMWIGREKIVSHFGIVYSHFFSTVEILSHSLSLSLIPLQWLTRSNTWKNADKLYGKAWRKSEKKASWKRFRTVKQHMKYK